jgi:hypothetical protein
MRRHSSRILNLPGNLISVTGHKWLRDYSSAVERSTRMALRRVRLGTYVSNITFQ